MAKLTLCHHIVVKASFKLELLSLSKPHLVGVNPKKWALNQSLCVGAKKVLDTCYRKEQRQHLWLQVKLAHSWWGAKMSCNNNVETPTYI